MSHRVLFVVDAGASDLAPWIGHAVDLGDEAHLFPSREQQIPSAYRGVVAWDAAPGDGDPSRNVAHASCGLPRDRTRVDALVEIVGRTRPDLVHSDDSAEATALVLAARARLGDAFPSWVLTLREPTAHLALRLPEAEAQARVLLDACDACLCERDADAEALDALGYRGPRLPAVPLVEGFDLASLDAMRDGARPSSRRVVRLDGGQDWSRRALAGLRALALSRRLLRGYRVVVDRAGEDVRTAAGLLARSAGLEITATGDGTPDDRLGRCVLARVSVGLGLADTTATGLFDAMAAGALPVQAGTSAATDWLRDGETGLLVPPEDPGAIALALQRALADDALVDEAAGRNARLVADRLDRPRIRAAVAATYEAVLGAPSATRRRLRRRA